jgi:hypothetical protein
VSVENLKRNCRQLQSDLKGIRTLAKAVPEFFRERITLRRAEEEIKKGLDQREERFLDLARAQIYGRPDSPYLRLLRFARCEFFDLQSQVRRCGLDETLERLAGGGVYLTAEEFKGKKPVVRGREVFRVSPGDFERPGLSAGYRTQSSGSANQPIRSFISLDLLRIRAPATCLFFAAHDLFSCAQASYDAILPASGGVNMLMIYAVMGVVVDRWFARKLPISGTIERAYHNLMTHFLALAARHFGPGFPMPEFITTHETDRIVQWAAAQRREKKACCITTAASNAARISRAAFDQAISLEGVKFIVSGEPFTESKRQAIERAGATATPRYAQGGGVNIGFGCANPLYTDEIHVNQDLLALVPNPRSLQNGSTPLHPLLCTTLHSSFPRLLLNVESGDYGDLAQRDCGCALGKVGLSLHLHHIRSFEKFTSEGMNYFYGDLFEFFENVLPAEFGGGPGDYQLVEEEDGNGQTRLTLLVHPQVGELNERKLLARLQESLAQGARGNPFMSKLWQETGTFRVGTSPMPAGAGRSCRST